ncbi:hypothetical protein Nmel_013294, partial [Mimus melanotis]
MRKEKKRKEPEPLGTERVRERLGAGCCCSG